MQQIRGLHQQNMRRCKSGVSNAGAGAEQSAGCAAAEAPLQRPGGGAQRSGMGACPQIFIGCVRN